MHSKYDFYSDRDSNSSANRRFLCECVIKKSEVVTVTVKDDVQSPVIRFQALACGLAVSIKHINKITAYKNELHLHSR